MFWWSSSVAWINQHACLLFESEHLLCQKQSFTGRLPLQVFLQVIHHHGTAALRYMLRWAWLKPRMLPDLHQRKWEGGRGEDSRPLCAPFVSLLLYSCAIWFTGSCFVFPYHYLSFTGGVTEFWLSNFMFHFYLSLLFCACVIESDYKIDDNHLD